MSKGLPKKWLTVAWVALVGVVVLGDGFPRRVEAQGPPTHQEILNQITTLQDALNRIVSSGVTCKLRRYYLTKELFNGAQARSACAAGFHMASLWEIFDTSNLVYDTVRGLTWEDGGSGPPSASRGWIRTGYFSYSDTTIAGSDNCRAWTSAQIGEHGTVVGLTFGWRFAAEGIGPWLADIGGCDFTLPVWCLENY